jgi:hypothetical protein
MDQRTLALIRIIANSLDVPAALYLAYDLLAAGLRVGLVIGLVTAISGSLTPFIEWTADRIPENQYWVALLEVGVR